MRICTLTLLVLVATGQLVTAVSQTKEIAAKQPVYVYLYCRLDDQFNTAITQERFKREVALIERYRKEHPKYGMAALLQFTGASSQSFADFNRAAGLVDTVLDGVRRGVLEAGYDGSGEPAYFMWPRPNFRNAKTLRDRWLARGEAAGWFLTEYKDQLTGEADSGGSGGLKKTQEIFGEVASITGVTPWELGGDTEIVHQVRRHNQNAIMAGLPESSVWPAKNIHGYGGGVAGIGSLVSPEPDFAPEIFWQDGFLRSSNTSGPKVHLLSAHAGPAALKKVLEGLDRSRVHVIRVELANIEMYLKPDFNKGVLDPIRFAYDNPKLVTLPPGTTRAKDEIDAAYGREEELMRWLVSDFFSANPGSRFISSSNLKGMAKTSVGSDVPRETLAKAVASLLAEWKITGNHPPSFGLADGEYFSLADMFQMLATSLAELDRKGSLPASVRLNPVYGPVDFDQDQGPSQGAVTVVSIARACAQLVQPLNNTAWKPFPDNFVPSRVVVDGTDLNAAQFLYLMAEAFSAPSPQNKLNVRTCQMSHGPALVFPVTRKLSEIGAMWTIKPARLRRLD
ncbi:MAG: hypothetical protein NTW28_28010 [Candidatus Solibacter sp.]|nr:hypothetical protein [Candidatus Solibacter sp.]